MTPQRPPVECVDCGELRKHYAHGRCKQCACSAWWRSTHPRTTWPSDELLSEVESLLDSDTDQALAARLGVTPGGIAQAARRRGRLDLARRFWRLDKSLRRSA